MLTHNGTNTITTERLILRRFEYTDNEAMLKNWVADEKIQSLYSEPVYSTVEAVKELLDKYIGSYEKNDYYRWAIIEKKSGECIGQIAYFLALALLFSVRAMRQKQRKQLLHMDLIKSICIKFRFVPKQLTPLQREL